jgi:hypothetical protein
MLFAHAASRARRQIGQLLKQPQFQLAIQRAQEPPISIDIVDQLARALDIPVPDLVSPVQRAGG